MMAFALVSLLGSLARGQVLEGVRFDQRLGAALPLDATFTDSSGRREPLGAFFSERPVIVVFTYFRCTMLCPEVLDALVRALRMIDLDAGRDFRVIAASFDPSDTAAEAAARQGRLARLYGRPGGGWSFLTAGPASIERLTRAAGFRAAYDPAQKQFAHAAGFFVATPQGTVSRYFFGVEYSPADLRLALIEASGGKVGGLVDQLLLYCYHYDPATGRYSVAITRVLRLAGVATVAAIALLIAALERGTRA